MKAKRRLNRRILPDEKLKHLIDCAKRAAERGTLRMQYEHLLDNAKQHQEKDYLALKHCLEDLTKDSVKTEDYLLYKEIANYILTDSNRYIYLSEKDRYLETNVNSLTMFLFKLRYSIVSSNFTCYWEECIDQVDCSTYLEPRIVFKFFLDLIQTNIVKPQNIIPLKDVVSTLEKYNKQLLEDEKLNEQYLRSSIT